MITTHVHTNHRNVEWQYVEYESGTTALVMRDKDSNEKLVIFLNEDTRFRMTDALVNGPVKL